MVSDRCGEGDDFILKQISVSLKPESSFWFCDVIKPLFFRPTFLLGWASGNLSTTRTSTTS